MHKYKIKYTIERGEFTPEDIKNQDAGLSDSVLFCSVVLPEDGSRSEQFVSYDGATTEGWTADDMFKSWVGLAYGLSKDPRLGDPRRALCKEVFELVRGAILKASRRR